MLALVGDNYTHFTASHLLVPFASHWEPSSVALGVVSFWMLSAVQLTSWMIKRLPKRAWRTIHLLSYLAFVTVTWHAIAAGTDASSRWYGALTIAVIALASAFGAARLLTIRTPTSRAPLSGANKFESSTPSAASEGKRNIHVRT
jgi:DMSO/TMAO reductase YedYZ heme-binding membrane subunit